MLLPNADKAIIKTEKITDYVLNFEHFEGKNKARVFASALDLKKENADYLINAIKEAILINNAIKQSASAFETKYVVDFELTFENKTARVRTAWIIENEDEIPRLTTCYIKL
ncbi:MAG TPA: hypothetical protein VN958_08080 [Chitinophagaceae bacterium]|nr:hypothetical protein [Chitinophagaceae bacterium]